MKPTNQISKILLVGLLSLSSVLALSACNKTNPTDTASETTTTTTETTVSSTTTPASTATPEASAIGANTNKADATKTDATKTDATTTADATKTDTTKTDATTTADATKTDATTAAAPEAGKTNNLVELATSEGDFKTLTAAIEAAGLTDTLKGDGPFTVFAPTDEAFAALPPGTLEELLKPENKDKLIKVLTYHVVPQQVASKDIIPGDVKTVEGEALKLEVDTASSEVRVNEAKVTKPDIQASNGVIHVVDKVILPPDVQLTPSPAN